MNPEEEEYIVGCLSAYRNLTEEQKDLFIKLVSDDCSSEFQILFNILDDDILTLEILDIFAGRRISFPDRKKLHKLFEKIQIYTFVKNRGKTADSYQLLAKQYKKRISQIKAVVERIEYLLGNGKYKDIENFENKESAK